MPALSIYLFGNVQVVRNRTTQVNLRPSAKEMLACLLLHHYRNPQRVGQRREILASRFWGNQDERQARRCLSTTLWRLRRELESGDVPHGTFLVTRPSGEISFNFASDHWLDVVTFEKKVKQGMAKPVDKMEPEDATLLEEAQQLYTGELLEDCYGDWVYRERERLNLLHLDSMARLMRYYTHRADYEKSLSYGHKILDIDPLREQVHRYVMRLYAESGQRVMAVQQYEVCRQILSDELGISPMGETQALAAQIAAKADAPLTKMAISTQQPATLEQALRQLKAAMSNLDQAQLQLEQAKQVVHRLTEENLAGDSLILQT